MSRSGLSPAPLAEAMGTTFPEARQTVRLNDGSVTVHTDEQALEE